MRSLLSSITGRIATIAIAASVALSGAGVPTPAGAGGFHAGFQVGATGFYEAPLEAAVGAALVLHVISFLPGSVLGVVFMAQEGVRLGGVRAMAVPALRRAGTSPAPVDAVPVQEKGRG